MCTFSFRQAHMQTLLHHEPPAARLPFLLRIHEIEIVLHEQSRDKLRPAKKEQIRQSEESSLAK